MSRDPEELLAAYVDGVGELTPDERRRVEQLLRDDPDARADEAATRELLGQLRDLPPLGTEPSWSDLEQAIGREVGPDVPRVPWWRRHLKWIESTVAVAATAAVALVWLSRGEPQEVTAPTVPHVVEAQTPNAVALWLDNEAVEVRESDALQLLDDFDDEIQALASEGDGSEDELLEYVDGLDDNALERAERWLEHEKKG